MRSARVCIVTAVLATSAVAVTSPAAGAAQRAGAPAQAGTTRPDVVYRDLPLPGGRHALVYSDGLAEVFTGGQSRVEFRWVPLLNPTGGTSLAGAGGTELPAKGDLIADLTRQASLPGDQCGRKPFPALRRGRHLRPERADRHPGHTGQRPVRAPGRASAVCHRAVSPAWR